MSKVIASIDGSKSTLSVCDYAAWFSQALKLPLELLHIVERSSAQSPQDFSGALGLGGSELLLEEMVRLEEAKAKIELQHSELLLQDAREYLQEKHQIEPHVFQRHGNLLDTVVALEAEFRVLIMGKQGKQTSQLSDKIGTQIENIVRAIHKPVLVVAEPFETPRSFLIAFDGSPTAKVCVQRICSSPLLVGLQAHLIYVGEPNQETQQEIALAQAQLQQAGFNPNTHILQGEVENTIIDYAEAQDISMLVVGAYGHSKIRQFFIGSSTTKLIARASKPVLLLR